MTPLQRFGMLVRSYRYSSPPSASAWLADVLVWAEGAPASPQAGATAFHFERARCSLREAEFALGVAPVRWPAGDLGLTFGPLLDGLKLLVDCRFHADADARTLALAALADEGALPALRDRLEELGEDAGPLYALFPPAN